MKTWFARMTRLAACMGLLLISSSTSLLFAEVKVAQESVGPLVDLSAGGIGHPYCVSPVGVHLAAIVHKGSRIVVVMDGVTGPKFDEIIAPNMDYIDPRPYQNVNINVAPTQIPVVFSQDGKHYAYVGRQSQEWVLMEDGKEVLRVPSVGTAVTDWRLGFAGDDGKHLLFARAIYGGYEFWVDGQKWPGLFNSGGGGSAGTVDPIVSADGAHIAYVAQISRDKQALILDGADAGYMGDNLNLSADGQHLYCINHSSKGDALLRDGKPLFTARQIIGYYLPSAGNDVVAQLTHRNQDGSTGFFLLVNGKPVEPSLSANTINNLIFSPDGKHYAAICGSSQIQFVVEDGKKGEEYQSISANIRNWGGGSYFTFSPDSTRLAYVATSNGKQYVVVNEDESDGYDNMQFKFNSDGKRLAYSGMASGMTQLVVDGKKYKTRQANAEGVTFWPDDSHFSYLDQGAIYIDGQPAGLGGFINERFSFVFSPDSKHYATIGARASDQKSGLLMDGQLIYPFDGTHLPRFCGFTPDNQHLYWFVMEPAAGADAGPGKYQWVTYLDGKAVARCDGNTQTSELLYRDFTRSQNGVTQLGKTPPSWSIGPDGTLTFLGIVDDAVVRFTVTPAADTSIATMLAGLGGGGSAAKPASDSSSNPTPKPAAAASTPAAQTSTVSSASNSTQQSVTNNVENSVINAVDKTKPAVDSLKHLFGH